jgi:hypothetical protein
MYNAGGVDELRKLKFNRPQSQLVAYKDSLEKYFTENPPSSISEAAAKIKELTGIERKETQVRKFMKSNGFRCLQVGVVPTKVMTEEKKRTKRISGQKTSTTIRGGQTWRTYCLFCRRCPFCTWRLYSLCLVHLSVIELLEKIREFHKNSVIPISIFLDNAKYQRCKAVTERADNLNIELIFLPSYSPNLNLIEPSLEMAEKRLFELQVLQ